jgi:hypothetical protein
MDTDKCCFHATGMGTSHWTGGGEAYRCCWCGREVDRRWRIVSRTVHGHGPRHSVNEKVREPLPDLPCPDRDRLLRASGFRAPSPPTQDGPR